MKHFGSRDEILNRHCYNAHTLDHSVAKDVCKRIVPVTQVVRFETKCLEVYGNLSSVSWVCHQLMVIFSQDFDSCWCCSRQNSLQSFSLSLSLLLSIHHYSHNCFSGVVVFGVAMSWRWLGRSLVWLGKVCMHTLHNWICHMNVSMQLFQCFFGDFCWDLCWVFKDLGGGTSGHADDALGSFQVQGLLPRVRKTGATCGCRGSARDARSLPDNVEEIHAASWTKKVKGIHGGHCSWRKFILNS